MRNKILNFVFVLFTIALLAGCGGGNPVGNDNQPVISPANATLHFEEAGSFRAGNGNDPITWSVSPNLKILGLEDGGRTAVVEGIALGEGWLKAHSPNETSLPAKVNVIPWE